MKGAGLIFNDSMKKYIMPAVFIFMIFINACGGGGGGGGGETPAGDGLSVSNGITIDTVNPGSAKSGSEITLEGKNFSITSDENLVISFVLDGNGVSSFSPKTLDSGKITFTLPDFAPDNYQIQTVKFPKSGGAPKTWSNRVNFTVLDSGSGSAPAVPDGLTLNTATENSLTISWGTVSDAASYNVYKSAASDGIYSFIGNTVLASFTDTFLNPETTYYYKVSAINSYGESTQSSFLGGTTSSASGTAPATPSGLSVTSATSGSLTISWNAVTGANGYELYRSTSSGGSYTHVITSNPASTSYVDSGLNSNTLYYYKVRAYNGNGISSLSSYQSGTTTGSAPSTPAGLSAGTATSGSLTITWNSVSEADGYRLYRSTISNGSYSLIASPGGTSYTDTGLNPATTYYYKIAAYNSDGESSSSSYQSGTTLSSGSTIPSTPTGLSVNTPTSASLTITWNSVFGADGYRLYRSTISNGSYSLIASPGGTSYADTGLNPSTPYYYRIAAYNSDGESTQSAYQSGTTAGTAPATPSGLTLSSSTSNSLTISWGAVSGATAYRVYRSSASNGSYSFIGETAVTMFQNTSLTSNTTYYYKVSASNVNGESPQSSNISAKTGFVVGTGTYSIPLGTYSYTTGTTTTSYVFSSGNGCQMITGSTAYSGSYSYNTSNGNLVMSFNIGSGMTMVQSMLEVFTVPFGSSTMLFIPGVKKTDTNTTTISGGTFQTQFTIAIPGYTSTTSVETLVFNANGTYTFTVTGSASTTHSWDPVTNTATDCFFAILNGYLYAGGGFTKQ